MKSILTEYEDISAFSQAPSECTHHLIFGRGLRELADKDGLHIPLTNSEHNMSADGKLYQVHDNPPAEKLSKMLGQVAWEKNYLAEKLANVNKDGLDEQSVSEWYAEARRAFLKRYQISYL